MAISAIQIIKRNIGRAELTPIRAERHLNGFASAAKTLPRYGLKITPDVIGRISNLRIGIASDHAGFDLKEKVSNALRVLGTNFFDFGPAEKPSVKLDYPAFAAAPLDFLRLGDLDRVVLVCGTGMGMEIVANKFPDVRAALAGHPRSVLLARKHSNINTLALGQWDCARHSELYNNLLAFLGGEFDSAGKNYARRLFEIEVLSEAARRDPGVSLAKNYQLDRATERLPELCNIWASQALFLLSIGRLKEGMEAAAKYVNKGLQDPYRDKNLPKIRHKLEEIIRLMSTKETSTEANKIALVIDKEQASKQ
jgi:ribose 5-phosphate isomerase B